MPRPIRRRATAFPKGRHLLAAACLGLASHTLQAQETAAPTTPATASTTPAPAPAKPKPVSERQARKADNAYLAGAKAIQRADFTTAERDFGKALKLDPSRPEYTQSLAVAREHRVADLVQQAATAHQRGDTATSDKLLAQAHTLAPDSPEVNQHFTTETTQFAVIPNPISLDLTNPNDLLGQRHAPTFGAPIELKPSAANHTFHQSGSAEDILRAVYSAYGIRTQFPNNVGAGHTARLDLEDADYATATRVVGKLTKSFAVPVQPDFALIVANTQEARDEYQPLLEETLYMPGLSGDAMAELANIARQVFDLKQVTASQTAGDILVRGDAGTLKLLNATFADMLNGSSDVQIDISLYEIDKSTTRNVGITTPSSVGGFSIYQEVQSLLTQNASLIQAAISSGALVLTGDPKTDILLELAVLKAAGVLGSLSQFTGLLGYLGTYSGIPLAGVYLGSGATLNLALNNSEVRTLDFAQLRASDHQAASFKAGTRYPVITGTYSSGVTSSALSGLTAAQQSLVSQYLGSSTSVSIPQFQYEDLGLTLKATPTIHGDGSVTLALDMKIEALGGTSINNVPVLNNRALASTITVPTGQTVLLASEITKSEMRSLSGVPGLSDIPGFQGTDHDTEKDSSELLIMLTPHIVRVGHRGSASKLLAYDQPAGTPQ